MKLFIDEGNDGIMERLTKDQFKTNEEFLLNYAYAKDGEIYVRHYDGDNDVSINKIVRELADRGDVTGVLEGVADEDIFDTLKEYSDYFSAVMLYLATQAAELREVVKRYEDAEENGTLIRPKGFCCDCHELRLCKNSNVYAECMKVGTIFAPFELDTRTHFCKYFTLAEEALKERESE